MFDKICCIKTCDEIDILPGKTSVLQWTVRKFTQIAQLCLFWFFENSQFWWGFLTFLACCYVFKINVATSFGRILKMLTVVL